MENYVAQDDWTETHKERKVTDEALKASNKHSSFSYYPQTGKVPNVYQQQKRLTSFSVIIPEGEEQENQKIGGVRRKEHLKERSGCRGCRRESL